MTSEDSELLALQMAVRASEQAAEREIIGQYGRSEDPRGLLRDRIYEIIAVSASSAIDHAPPQRPIVSEPWGMREGMSRTASRLQNDLLFHRMVAGMTNMVTREVRRYEEAMRK